MNYRINAIFTNPIKKTGTDLFLGRLSNVEACPKLIKPGFRIRGPALMKKTFFIYGVILIMFLVMDYAAAQPKPHDNPCQGSEANPDGCPRVRVEVNPGF